MVADDIVSTVVAATAQLSDWKLWRSLTSEILKGQIIRRHLSFTAMFDQFEVTFTSELHEFFSPKGKLMFLEYILYNQLGRT